MSTTSRSVYSARNVAAIWLGQAVSLLCTFVVRMVFVRYLTQDYLGLETLFSNVITMLSLAELGVGSAMVYSLYKPLAEGDKDSVKSIMRLFRRAYVAIGVVIAVVGLALAPNITLFIEDAPDIPNLNLYFLFFVFNSALSYFFSYKGLLLTADQKNYVVALVRYAFQIVLCAVQVAVLAATQNYLLFLMCMLCATLGQNIVTVVLANRAYPYLLGKNINPVDKDVLGGIKRNVVGMIVHKVSSVVNAPVNTVVVSSLLGLGPVAVYGNYLLVANSLSKIVDQMFDSVVSSIGNLSVTASESRQYEVFETAHFVNAFLYGSLGVCFLPLVSPFVEMAFGREYLLDNAAVVLFFVLFYFRGMRDAALSFVSAHGLYWQTKYKAIAETVVLLVLVPLLTKLFGIPGLLAANIVVQVFISLFLEGYILHRSAFSHRMFRYFFKTVRYAVVAFALGFAAFFTASLLPSSALVRFLAGGVLCVIIGFGGHALVFHRTHEFREAKRIALSFMRCKAKKVDGQE